MTNDLGQLFMTAEINPNAGASYAWFEFGPTAAYGGATPPQLLSDGISLLAVSNVISSYQPGVPFHYRCAASNSLGVSFGMDVPFIPPSFLEMNSMFLAGSMNPAAQGIMVWADYDRDGRLDLIGNNQLLRNETSRMTNRTDFPGQQGLSWYPGPALADYRHTGNFDILAMGSQLKIFNNDSGLFSKAQIFSL